MIKLTGDSVTTVQYLSGTTVVGSVVTDVLYIQSVRLDFSSGALYATISRGTTDANGVFSSNYPSLDIVVNPDGSFISSDGKWTGALNNVSALMNSLKSQFDQFILLSGMVKGSAI